MLCLEQLRRLKFLHLTGRAIIRGVSVGQEPKLLCGMANQERCRVCSPSACSISKVGLSTATSSIWEVGAGVEVDKGFLEAPLCFLLPSASGGKAFFLNW